MKSGAFEQWCRRLQLRAETHDLLARLRASLPGRRVQGRAHNMSGWQAWTPLLVGGFALITAVVFSINLYLHFILLGLWGLPWLLVGYVVFTHAAREQAQHHVVSDGSAHPQGQRLG